MKKYLLTVLLFVFFTVTAQAEAFKVNAEKIDEIHIIALEGQIRVNKTTKPEVFVKANLKKGDEDNWSLLRKIENKILRIELQSFLDQRDMTDKVHKNQYPVINISISSPDKKLKIYLRKGQVDVTDWKSDITVEAIHGKISIANTEGDIKVSTQSGRVNVLSHVGPVDIDSYSATVKVQKLKGSIKLQNFSGVTEIAKSESDIELSTQGGNAVIDGVEGKINFSNSRAAIKITGFEGAIRGQSGQGDIDATIKGKADIRVRTKEGKVKVRALSSGAFINAGSKEGPLYTPSHLKLTRYANIKVVNGHLRGSKSGRIFVRTESGAVFIK